MKLVVSKKLFKEFQAALMLQFFGMNYGRARHAMLNMACWSCRKERFVNRVWTVWYRRCEGRQDD